MGQKIHPLGFRLGITQEHRSKWFANSHDYSKLVLEDSQLREILHSHAVQKRREPCRGNLPVSADATLRVARSPAAPQRPSDSDRSRVVRACHFG